MLASTTGNRFWRLKYRLGKREKLLTFGSYPDVSLIRARELREAAKATPRDGRDPAVEKKQAAAGGPSQRRTSSRHAPGNGARSTNRAGARRMSPHSGRFAPTLAWRRFPSRRTLHSSSQAAEPVGRPGVSALRSAAYPFGKRALVFAAAAVSRSRIPAVGSP